MLDFFELLGLNRMRVALLLDLWDYGAAVAQGTHNPLVVGSNPSGPKKDTPTQVGMSFL